MSISSVTIESLIAIVRALVKNYITEPFIDDDYTAILNAKQAEIFARLPYRMKEFWYGTTSLPSLAADLGGTELWCFDKPSDMFDIVMIRHDYTEGSDTKRITCEEVDPKSLAEYQNNELLVERKAYSIVGSKIYTTLDGAPSGTYSLWYIRTPVDMDSGNDMDLPTEYRQLLVALACSEIVSTAVIDSESREAILQVFALREKNAYELLSAELGSAKVKREELASIGQSSGDSGGKGSHASTE
jgi:hypothetical protein